jgi:hypothetical protein
MWYVYKCSARVQACGICMQVPTCVCVNVCACIGVIDHCFVGITDFI